MLLTCSLGLPSWNEMFLTPRKFNNKAKNAELCVGYAARVIYNSSGQLLECTTVKPEQDLPSPMSNPVKFVCCFQLVLCIPLHLQGQVPKFPFSFATQHGAEPRISPDQFWLHQAGPPPNPRQWASPTVISPDKSSVCSDQGSYV
ncbi:hypothetical protein Ancab_034704 [Ancistrocladus abbreviatus]